MKTFILAVIIITQQVTVNTQKINAFLPKPDECGKLKEQDFYNEEENAEFNEYPWIGHIMFKNMKNQTSFAKCGAILISKRHLLTNGACFNNMEKTEPTVVVLGKIKIADTAPGQNCNSLQKCGPEPQIYDIDDIGLHPNNLNTKGYNLHNIAVVRVAKDIEFNDYIQPICLPTNLNNNTDFFGQYLPYVGYDLKKQFMKKIIAHVRSVTNCKEIYKDVDNLDITENNICASCNKNITFLSGSALMGVSVENTEPRFYLIGLMSAGSQYCSTKYPDIFMKISSYLEWIMFNMI